MISAWNAATQPVIAMTRMIQFGIMWALASIPSAEYTNCKAAGRRADLGCQIGKPCHRSRIQSLIEQAFEEAVDPALAFGRQEFFERPARKIAEGGIIHFAARRADDGEVFGEQPISIQRRKAGQLVWTKQGAALGRGQSWPLPWC